MLASKNVLLINPWIYDFAAYDLWIKPLGLLYIASFLAQYGYTVELLDCLQQYEKTGDAHTHKFFATDVEKPAVFAHVPRKYKRYGIPIGEFRKRLDGIKTPDLIGITCLMTYWYPGVQQAVRLCREFFPNVPIVLGGAYATLCTEHARQVFLDVKIMPGLGQLEMLRQADAVSHVLRDYQSLSNDFFSVRPAYQLYPEVESVALLTSLGCPFACTYCASNILQPRFIQNSVEAVLREIDYYVNVLHVRDIAFYDDALLVNKKEHIKPLLREIARRDLPLNFHTPNGLHISLLDEELAELMSAARIKDLRLSFESSDAGRQSDSSGKTSNEALMRAVGILIKVGYKPADLAAYVLMGLPGQSLEQVRKSVEFVHRLGIQVQLAEYSPVPHTRDFELACRINPLLDAEPLLQNNSAFPFLKTKGEFEEFFHFKTWVKELNKLNS